MKKQTVNFSSSSTTFYFASGISHLKDIADVKHVADDSLSSFYQATWMNAPTKRVLHPKVALKIRKGDVGMLLNEVL